ITYSGSPYCPSGTALVTRTGSPNGTYSASPAGLALNSSNGNIDLASSTPGTYTVTYMVGTGGGGCSNTASTQVTVSNRPTVNATANQVFCPGATSPIAFTGTGATSFSWTNSNPAIGLAASGSGMSIPSFIAVNNGTTNASATINVTAMGACPGNMISFRINVSPVPTVNAVGNQVYCRGANTSPVTFSSAVPNATFSWTRTNTAIGLTQTSGWNAIPTFSTQNATAGTLTSIVTVTPWANKCAGAPMQFTYFVDNCITQAGSTGGDAQQSRLADQVTVGPNPTQGQLTIWYNGKSEGPLTVELLDQYGRTLTKPATFTGSNYTMSLAGYTAGTYLVRIVNTDTKESVQRKVIKL
ncbi:MAG: T9SS type A sorting domain-containing protein, partial [Sphingobacteriales bacterium]